MRESSILRARLVSPALLISLLLAFVLPSMITQATAAGSDRPLIFPSQRESAVPASTTVVAPIVTRFVVDAESDDADGTVGDGVCASPSGKCTLRAALQEANADVDPSLILLPAGVFGIEILGAGDDAGISGDFDVRTNLTINGAGQDLTVISGGGLDRVLDIASSGQGDINVVLSNLTVRDGTDRGTNAAGGVRIRSAAVLLDHVAVRDVIGEGIGIDEGQLTLSDSRVSDCVGIGVGGLRAHASVLWINRSSIEANRGVWGGLSSDTQLVMSASTVAGNQGSIGPGGMHLKGSVLITNSTISGNRGGEGGGLWSEQGEIMLINSTITENRAEGNGGDWRSGKGGGIFFSGDQGSVLLQDTILAGNHASSGAVECAGKISSNGYNLLGDVTGCEFSAQKTDVLRQETRLGPLQDNGGGTRTHALLQDSPAIDAGDPNGCRTADGGALKTDQRGEPRPAYPGAADHLHTGQARCDVGAFEGQSASPRPTSVLQPSPQATPTGPARAVSPTIEGPEPTWIPITPLAPLVYTPSPQTTEVSPPPPDNPADLPRDCRETILNGGFEDEGGWIFPATEYTAGYDREIIHSGSRSARAGILRPQDDRFSYSSLWQRISIPPAIRTATLSFWLYPQSVEPVEEGASGDLQLALLLDEPGWSDLHRPVRETLLSTRSDTRVWTRYQFDLTQYAGRELWLYFGVYNNGRAGRWGSPLAMYVDDVSLIICQP